MQVMPWTYDEIEREWLSGSKIAASESTVEESFNRCERMLGRGWIEQFRPSGAAPGGVTATVIKDGEELALVDNVSKTLHVVSMGEKLAAIEGVAGSELLVSKLISGDASTDGELEAIHILRSIGPSSLELFPKLRVGTSEKCPDFRIRREPEDWVYVEVTKPDTADVQARVAQANEAIAAVVDSIDRPFGLEVFLHREPTDSEISTIVERIQRLCAITASGQEELSDGLGFLFLAAQPPSKFEPDDHGEEPRPRLGMATMRVMDGKLLKFVAVRVPYTDERAQHFLKRESKQLSREHPGLVMVHMGKAPGGFKRWPSTIERCFQPAVHTRVGGVCLFSTGLVLTDRGVAVLSETKMLKNPHATEKPLPAWIDEVIEAAGAEYMATASQA